MIKKIFFLAIGLFLLSFLSLGLIEIVDADFSLGSGNSSYSLNTNYGPLETISGWINMSLEEELSSSLLFWDEQNISLIEFLDANDADYDCFPSDCSESYLDSNGVTSKTFSLGYLEDKLIGLKIFGEVSEINSLSFNLSNNAGKSCQNPIKIDILDDSILEYKYDSASDEFTCLTEAPYGGYKSTDSTEETPMTLGSIYCERIDLPVNRKVKIGANVMGSGNAQFKMSIDIGSDLKNCDINIANGGEISCSVDFGEDLSESVNADVCIEPINLNGNVYTIKYEDVNPCGYSGDYEHDFPIFARPAKYNSMTGLAFSQSLIDLGSSGINIGEEIFDYVDEKYNRNCSQGCIIPIKIYSGVEQDINIYNLTINYKSEGLAKTENKIYDIEKNSAILSSSFNKLDLAMLGFKVPSKKGNYTFDLEMNDETLITKKIYVQDLPVIESIFPIKAPAYVPTLFGIVLNGNYSNLTYTWDFGNEDIEETSTNSLRHTYQELGTYDLKVSVSNKYGNTSKTVSVSVVSPKEYINSTIVDYRKRLDTIDKEVAKLPSWISTQIKKEFDSDSLRADIKAQEDKYKNAFTDEEYTEVMKELMKINVPSSFNLSQSLPKSKMLLDSENIDLDALDYFGAGNVDEDRDEYIQAVTNWLINKVELQMELKTYALYYEDGSHQDLNSYLQITMNPKEDLGEVYFVINGDPVKIKINGEVNSKDFGESAVGIIYSEMTDSEVVEFLYPGKIELNSIPVYVSPEFKNLEFGVVPGVCNSNKKCEKDLGENYKNCRADCKPWGWTVLWLFILLFIAFFVYVILQEWYKRYYESHLFPSRNQLFNLINFMHNSNNQGLRRADILDKLKEMGWTNEQLTYAWNKFQGKRTGMWEIPIFKWVENKQVKQEIQRRQYQNDRPMGLNFR